MFYFSDIFPSMGANFVCFHGLDCVIVFVTYGCDVSSRYLLLY